MKLLTGLFNRIVLQRNARNVSDVLVTGTASMNGPIRITAHRGSRRLAGFTDKLAGKSSRGIFRIRLAGLPAGGPYTLTLRLTNHSGQTLDSIVVNDVLVGDVWLLGGQSNMEGIGLIKAATKADPLVHAFYMNDRWAPARDPIHNLWQAIDPIHTSLNGGNRPVRNPICGVGPGVAFGQAMRAFTGVPQGLIACAHGGTSMSQWDPALRHQDGHSLYGALCRRLRMNGGKVAGLIWYQGCSDADNQNAPLYTPRMKALVRAVRRDTGNRALPIVMAQISRVVSWAQDEAAWDSIRDQQRRLPGTCRNLAVVPTIDLKLDDPIHIAGIDQARLGKRLAQTMNVLRGGAAAGKPPITLDSATCGVYRTRIVVTVNFRNVAGALRSGSRPWGFTVIGPTGADTIIDVALQGNRAIIMTTLPRSQARDLTLSYGHGFNPYCNVTDEADRSVPAFGPIPLDVSC